MRKKVAFEIKKIPNFKIRLLRWASQFEEVVWLDSNEHHSKYHSYEAILAVDALTVLKTDDTQAFDKLKEYQQQTKDWLFGYLSYDLKNDVEALSSANKDGLNFPDLYFFQPKKIISINEESIEFNYLNMVSDEIESDLSMISNLPVPPDAGRMGSEIKIKLRIFKDAYYKQVNKMLAHIHRGDIYEANFCQEFFAENTVIDPLRTYFKLNDISKAPFAAYLKLEDKFLLSASPERYLRKEAGKVISQPIKGTAQRSKKPSEDLVHRNNLKQDAKERAENIMIVDLVRNDLSKSAQKGSVEVEELCAVYSFEQVHQMISTVSATVPEDKNPVDILRETFPMGSMTGAPKVSAMKIIEELEDTKRGLYSGAVGYISPENDFDFNVVIRSILYNHSRRFVSYSVGSAITSRASPEKEYEECLLKAKAMRQVLEG
ncbi:MAG: anthranilate synthase component I family protein [Eudoraea sp.]|nr:anthranilate synthase component I family protein [Eudoraea sp.]